MISVMIPAYNAEKTIVACLESVLCQSMQDFEVIIINDGSTDKTPCILDAYAAKDRRVRVIHQENQGISSARNRLVQESIGEELFFLDADDCLLDTCLEVLHHIMAVTGVPCICCNHYIVHNGIRKKRFEQAKTLSVLTAEQAIAGMLYHRVPDVSPWGKLYRRELLQQIHYPEERLFEDSYVFADLLLAAGQIAFTPEPLYDYMWSDTSISKCRNEAHLWDFYDAVEYMTHVVEKAFPEMMRGCVRRRAHAAMSVMRTLDPKLHKADWKRARKLLCREALCVLIDRNAPNRDKLGILTALCGPRCYCLIWKLYTENRKTFC